MVTTFYPPYHFGGDGTYVRALSEALVKRGHEVTVVHCEDAYRLAGNDPDVVNTSSKVNVHTLKNRFGFLSPLITQQTGFPGLKHQALKDILEDKFDVVNFHNISLIGGPGIIKLSNARVNIYTLHEHWLLCPTHIFWKDGKMACDDRRCFSCCLKSGIPPQVWRYTSLIQNSIRKIDSFISPSNYTAEQHKSGGIKNPIKIIPLFSNLSPSEYQDESQGKMNFVTVGRITASKGIAELVKSFLKWPEFNLQVIGDGDQLQSLKGKYQKNRNIQFLGKIPQDLLIQLYRKATALILPSLAPETFGLTVVEAFACGVPAIVRVAGGNREIIDHNGAGYLYSNEDELKTAIECFNKDPDLRSRLGNQARSAYEKEYTAKKHIDAYLDLVFQIASEKAKTGGIEHASR
jgi:glycosyltransferase involved in cell wall biosynthesis